MALRPDYNAIISAGDRLIDALSSAGVSNPGDILSAIDDLIEARLEAKIVDLENKINKTGEWSPDY